MIKIFNKELNQLSSQFRIYNSVITENVNIVECIY